MGCIFCNIISGNIPSKKVYEDESIFAFKDINPQAPVHILVVPKKHLVNILEIKEEDKELIFKIHQVINKLAKDNNIAKKGFRIVLNCNREGGQTVDHLHFHLVGGRFMTWPPG